MKFLADTMLGRLARWLRFIGYDTLYPPVTEDRKLIDIALREDRILLTRDRTLSKTSAKIERIYIESDEITEQLKQLVADFRLDLDKNDILSRCGVCNTQLLAVAAKESVQNHVPDGVYARQDRFWVCPNCNRYYWQGTHYEKIMKCIEALQESPFGAKG